MNRTLGLAAISLALLASGAASACSADDADSAAPSADHAAEHGSGHDEEHSYAEGDADTPTPDQDGWNDADVAFLEQMVPHHRQALDMTALAASRAETPEVRALAARIEAAQSPEILVMASWLTDYGLEVPDGHVHHEMAGMLTDQQMADLAQAEGPAFDRLFLEGMVQHHQGAVDMALVVLDEGEALRVNELAGDVNASQSAEIARMEALLAAL